MTHKPDDETRIFVERTTGLNGDAKYIEIQQCDLDFEEAIRACYAINGPVVSLIAEFRETHSAVKQ